MKKTIVSFILMALILTSTLVTANFSSNQLFEEKPFSLAINQQNELDKYSEIPEPINPNYDAQWTAIADVNNDGKNEVIACTNQNDPRVLCLDGDDGERIWEYVRDLGTANFRFCHIEDLNDDPYKEILLEYWLYYGVSSLTGNTGKNLWIWSDPNQGGSFQSIITADLIDEYSGKEIIAAGVNGIHCLKGGDYPSGDRRVWHMFIGSLYTDFVMGAASGDIDKDGLLDIAVITFRLSDEDPNCHVSTYNGQDGSLIWKYYDCGGDAYNRGILCVDLTKDGYPEVVAKDMNYVCALETNSQSQVDLMWSHPGNGPNVFSSFINGDDILDIIVSNYAIDGANGKTIYSIDAGQLIAVGDINNNMGDEIITSKSVTKDGEDISIIHCLNALNGEIIWTRDIDSAWILHASIGDLTGDLTNEVVLATGDYTWRENQFVYCLDGNTGEVIWRKKTSYIPSRPIITGPVSGKIGVPQIYTIVSTDPEGLDLLYRVTWDDRTTAYYGPYPSGTPIQVCHMWSEGGNYKIIAKARNTKELWSNEGELDVWISKSKTYQDTLFLRLLQLFPNAFQLLRLILKL